MVYSVILISSYSDIKLRSFWDSLKDFVTQQYIIFFAKYIFSEAAMYLFTQKFFQPFLEENVGSYG